MCCARLTELKCHLNGAPWLRRVEHANTFWSRLRGLLGRDGLPPDAALLLEPCNAVHTLGMRFAIGVVYLAADNRVLKVIPSLPPGRLGPTVWGARRVLETHPSRLEHDALPLGSVLHFAPAEVSR
ncbi:MAG: DUF192 domain-containing protein [Candidatus Sericytochromatia bacterium]